MSAAPRPWRRILQRLVLHQGAALANALIVGAALAGFVALVVGRRPQLWWFTAFVVAIPIVAAGAFWVRWMRERVIRESPLPQFLKRKLRDAYPHLDGRDCDLVERAFRQFFIACARSDRRLVAMPSRGVDAYWHEFILHTKAYRDWCDLTLGSFLDHTPSEAMGTAAKSNDGLRRAWFWSCREESIDPRKPSRLPLLFAIDAKLDIANGFRYAADCRALRTASVAESGDATQLHCGTDFADPAFRGDAAGMGGVDPPRRTDGGGDGGGCAGSGCSSSDGCGSGCGGGGD